MANTKSIIRLLERNGFAEVCSDHSYPLQGTFVREVESAPYNVFDVIVATDLEGACGADGQVLVEAYSTCFDFARGREDWLNILSCMDTKSYLPGIAKKDRRIARLILASDFVQYGKSDPAGYGQSWWVAVSDREWEKDAREKWENNRVYGWGYAAIQRAVENCIAACNGETSVFAYHDYTISDPVKRIRRALTLLQGMDND